MLPSGLMVTTRAGGNVWSYPNTHGDYVATTNASDMKLGWTVHYDSTALPDNAVGSFDYGWLVQYQRPLEHESGFAPIIDMGAPRPPRPHPRGRPRPAVVGQCALDLR